MSIGRQKKHQPIALSDILADEHQLTPGSDSDAHDLDRMHIHIDMPDSRYWGTRRLDTLARTSSGGPQSTVAYQDVASFSSVSSTPSRYRPSADWLPSGGDGNSKEARAVTDQCLGLPFQLPGHSRRRHSLNANIRRWVSAAAPETVHKRHHAGIPSVAALRQRPATDPTQHVHWSVLSCLRTILLKPVSVSSDSAPTPN